MLPESSSAGRRIGFRHRLEATGLLSRMAVPSISEPIEHIQVEVVSSQLDLKLVS
jgi:hypothetical protein